MGAQCAGQCSALGDACAIKVLGPCLTKLYEANSWESIDQEDGDMSPVLTPPDNAFAGSCAIEGLELGEAAQRSTSRARSLQEESQSPREGESFADIELKPTDVRTSEVTVLPTGAPDRPPGMIKETCEEELPSPPISPSPEGGSVPPYKYDIKEAMRRNVRAATEQLESGDGWKKDSQKHGAQIFVKEIAGMTHIKTVCQIKAQRELIVHVLNTQKLSKQSSEPTVIEHLSTDMFVYWIGVKVPIIKDRDFVICEWNHAQSTKHINAFVSVDHPQCRAQKKYERAQILMGMWLIESAPHKPNLCRVTHVTGVDPMGELPGFLKKSGATASADAVIMLKKLSETAAKEQRAA